MNPLSRKNNVLIAIDDLALNDYLRTLLFESKLSFSVDISSDTHVIMKMLKEKEYCCLIVDFSMKDSNDLNLLQIIENHGNTAPIIITSEHEDDFRAVSNLKHGAYDFIPKRFIRERGFKSILINLIRNSINLNKLKIDSRRTIQSLEMREERYRTIVENSPMLILRFSPEDRMISFVNDGFCNYFGTTRYEILGENFYEIIPDDTKEKITGIIYSMKSSNQITTFENHTEIGDSRKWQLWSLQVLCDDNDNILEFQCMGKDITDIKLVQLELQSQKKYLQSILDSQDNMVVVSKGDEIILSNTSFLNFFGYQAMHELKHRYKSVVDLAYSMDDYAIEFGSLEWIKKVTDDIEKQNLIAFKPETMEYPRIFAAYGRRLISDDETYVISFTDVTEMEMKSKKLEHKASFDMLTNIYNRQKLEELFINELIKIKKGANLSVIFFDIDFFKKINDSYGHDVGDSVLTELALFVKQSIRNSDIFARWGGEEFIILLPGVQLEIAVDVAVKLRKKIRKSKFRHINSISCSFGVTEASNNDSIPSILKRADKALYKAKETGRDKVVICRNS